MRHRTLTTETVALWFDLDGGHRERGKHVRMRYRRGIHEPYYELHFAVGRHARKTWNARIGLAA